MTTTPRHTSSMTTPQSAQVIVVGAGLSGLQAAYRLQQAGVSCMVLEARRHLASPVWYSGLDRTQHPRLASLGRELGVELSALETNGSLTFTDETNPSFIRVRDNLESLCQRVDINRPAQLLPNYGSSTLHELVVSQGGDSAVQVMAESWSRSLFGRSARHVSALYFLLHCKSAGGLAQVLVTLDTESSSSNERQHHELCQELAAKLHPGSLRLGHAVDEIDQNQGNKCVVTTKTGHVLMSTYVIVAAAASHCRCLRFLPDLSEDKQWLRDFDAAAEMDTEPDAALCLECQMSSSVDEHDWACLAVPAAKLRELERDQWRPEGAVFFAGSETSYVWRGHAEGALTAADRAVEEVLYAMGRLGEAPCSRL